MSRAFAEIAFTPKVQELQVLAGSRQAYARYLTRSDRGEPLGPREAAFVAARDGFYLASVGESGWPYVQFRGGPAGFVRVMDSRTIGYADFRGNRQYISAGNLEGDDRVSLIFMDYANRARLKMFGRARQVSAAQDPGLVRKLAVDGYDAEVERGVVIRVEGVDWNCPQHITPRFTEEEFLAALQSQ